MVNHSGLALSNVLHKYFVLNLFFVSEVLLPSKCYLYIIYTVLFVLGLTHQYKSFKYRIQKNLEYSSTYFPSQMILIALSFSFRFFSCANSLMFTLSSSKQILKAQQP